MDGIFITSALKGSIDEYYDLCKKKHANYIIFYFNRNNKLVMFTLLFAI